LVEQAKLAMVRTRRMTTPGAILMRASGMSDCEDVLPPNSGIVGERDPRHKR
jgi:hypothetical protein